MSAGGGSLVDRVLRRLPHRAALVVTRLRDDEIVLRSAALAFYGLVSAIPFVILLLWLMSVVAGDDRVRELGNELARLAPERLGVDHALERISQTGASAGVGAIATLLWPATSYGSGLARAFESPRSRRHAGRRPLRGRGLSVVLLLALPGLLLAALVAAYAGTAVVPDGGVFLALQWVLVVGFGFAATAGLLMLIYWVFPPERLSWPQLRRGALTAATGITVLSSAYVVYLQAGANFETRYAASSLAAVVLFAFWLFVANGLVLVGYELATEV